MRRSAPRSDFWAIKARQNAIVSRLLRVFGARRTGDLERMRRILALSSAAAAVSVSGCQRRSRRIALGGALGAGTGRSHRFAPFRTAALAALWRERAIGAGTGALFGAAAPPPPYYGGLALPPTMPRRRPTSAYPQGRPRGRADALSGSSISTATGCASLSIEPNGGHMKKISLSRWPWPARHRCRPAIRRNSRQARLQAAHSAPAVAR